MAVETDTNRDLRRAITLRDLPELDDLVARLKLPDSVVYFARMQGGGSLDHGFLAFNRVYRVVKDLTANRMGALAKDDHVRFLGSYVFPYDNGLRLHFEPADASGAPFCLEFEGNFPEADGVVRMISDRNIGTFFTRSGWHGGSDTRAQDLHEAEGVLRRIRFETNTQIQATYDAAQDEETRP